MHLNAVCEVISWLRAAGRNNYARYVPVYLAEMRQRETNQPIQYSFLKNGGFVIRRTSNKTFNCVASDQALEQTIKREFKSSGGIICFTLRKSALQRWISTRHIIGDYASAFTNLVRPITSREYHHEQSPARLIRDKADINKLVELLCTQC